MTLGLPQMDHFPGAPSALGAPAPTDSSRNARNTRTAESFRIRLDLPAVFSVPLTWPWKNDDWNWWSNHKTMDFGNTGFLGCRLWPVSNFEPTKYAKSHGFKVKWSVPKGFFTTFFNPPFDMPQIGACSIFRNRLPSQLQLSSLACLTPAVEAVFQDLF